MENKYNYEKNSDDFDCCPICGTNYEENHDCSPIILNGMNGMDNSPRDPEPNSISKLSLDKQLKDGFEMFLGDQQTN